MSRQKFHIAVIFIVTVLITGLHFSIMQQFSHYIVLEELYYVPLLLGVLRFGLKGAVVTYLYVSLAYIPFFFGEWAPTVPQQVDRVLHLIISGLVALAVGLLVERERIKHRQAVQERYFSGIGQAATVIVHDLKNPLISIQGFAKRLLEGKGDTLLAVRTIFEAAQTMQKIVNDVLEFARPLRLNCEALDVRQSIQQACESCRTKADVNGVSLVVNLPDKPIMTEVDTFQLKRSLVNLIDNSVDASSRGEQVDITAVSARNKVTITIKDRGAGMDQETLDNLFTLTYTTKAEGTGFGVPISKKIIEAHGGSIRIVSKKNLGTEVIIDLPVR